MMLQSRGDAYYNSLQTQVTKRISHGLQFQFSYTWAKLLSTGSSTASIEGLNNQNQLPRGYSQRFDRGPGGYDIRHAFRGNYIYRLPEFTQQSVLGKFTNGWWLSGILIFQGAYPFTPTLSGDRYLAQNNSTTQRPNLAPGFDPKKAILGTPERWFDPTMFEVPVAGRLGNSGVGVLRGPKMFNTDVSLVKDTKVAFLGEQGSLQFRCEVFNILNRANFALPTTTVWQATGGAVGTTAAGPIVDSPSAPRPAFAQAGQINGLVNNNRQIQFALKLVF
jgi:hypothetical protein